MTSHPHRDQGTKTHQGGGQGKEQGIGFGKGHVLGPVFVQVLTKAADERRFRRESLQEFHARQALLDKGGHFAQMGLHRSGTSQNFEVEQIDSQNQKRHGC